MGWVLGLAVLSGCSCSARDEPVTFPDADLDFDGAAADAGPGRDGMSCAEGTPAGCPCPTEGETRPCTGSGVGRCGMGTQTCVAGLEFPIWGECADLGEPIDEACNGVDDDCDATTDEGFSELSCGTGVCAATAPECVSGVPQSCVPGRGTEEECNGLDDDCDDSVDEAFADLTCGTGACATTVAACLDGVPQECTPGAPATEICNGADDDCDGSTDEGLGNVSCGTGACMQTVTACVGGVPQTCTPGTPTAETCNGIDDDCNGMIDDGFGTMTCGVGECRRVVVDCSGGSGMTCTPGAATAEVCDGLDNDCDGTADDGIAAVSCGVGACARTQPGCVGGTPATCTPGTPSAEACNGIDDDCDGMVDDGLGTRTCGTGACRRTVMACAGGVPQTCTPGSPAPEVCGDGIDDDCDGTVDDGCGCDVRVDADFDGYNECVDCDDADGSVHPGRAERCNGADDDCDGSIDEDFDADSDGYGTCSPDPLLRDCDDTRASVNPGATESCGSDGRGNGIDDNCNGFVDETCAPCDTVDNDGDGFSECMGDCDDTRGTVSPGTMEICDGFDNDCNVFTTRNCDVSDPCNFTSMADVCRDDLLCGCVVTAGGTCTGNYICTSFCEGSFTGALGSGCTATQSCFYRVTITDNQHGCAESTGTLGTRLAGQTCGSDAECRSGDCDRLCIGPGCSGTYCLDYCSHHAPGSPGSCATGTVCEILRSTFMSPAMYARCMLDDNGTGGTGASCASGGTSCRWGAASCVSGVCAQPCAIDAQCPSGTHCSLRGNAVSAGTWGTSAPPGVAGQPAVETVPVCLGNTGAGLHDRPAGAACTRNGDCRSQFCESTLGVCISLCTSDATCPSGLDCELQYVRTPTGVLSARVCVSTPTTAVLTSF